MSSELQLVTPVIGISPWQQGWHDDTDHVQLLRTKSVLEVAYPCHWGLGGWDDRAEEPMVAGSFSLHHHSFFFWQQKNKSINNVVMSALNSGALEDPLCSSFGCFPLKIKQTTKKPTFKIFNEALPGGSVYWTVILCTKKLRVQSPVRAHTQVVSSFPAQGKYGSHPINVFLSLPSSLSKRNEKISLGNT